VRLEVVRVLEHLVAELHGEVEVLVHHGLDEAVQLVVQLVLDQPHQPIQHARTHLDVQFDV